MTEISHDLHAQGNAPLDERPVLPAMRRGFSMRCPRCGEGKLFRAYLKSVDACAVCGEEIHHHRADDLPPYLTVFIVAHVVVALFMAGEQYADLSMWVHLAIWIPVTIVMSLALLQPLKGLTIGLQWALRMGGFGSKEEETDQAL